MPARRSQSPPSAPPEQEEDWLRAFHAGDREALTRCYEEYLPTVAWAVGGVVDGIDRETVVHEVFCRLFENEAMRASFSGGNLGAWLITVARRQAVDFRRRRGREEPAGAALAGGAQSVDPRDELELRALAERFVRTLPAKWVPVFRARFLEQLDQREAARRLGMHRTTLAYQELQVRKRLRLFVLEQDR